MSVTKSEMCLDEGQVVNSGLSLRAVTVAPVTALACCLLLIEFTRKVTNLLGL